MCMCVNVGAHTPVCVCGSQQEIWGSQFSPFVFTWVLAVRLARHVVLPAVRVYLLAQGYLFSPKLFILYLSLYL